MILAVYRSVPALIGAAVVAAVMALAGRLFGGPGYEGALLAGLVLPSTVAVSSAIQVVRSEESPIALTVWSLENALWQSMVALLVLLLFGWMSGFCSLSTGLALFALGPVVGGLLGAVWGAVAGIVGTLLSSRRARLWMAVGLALSGPVAGILISLWRFYTSPMVYALDPFFGLFSGAIYDTVIDDMLGRLLTYRVGSLAMIVCLTAALSLVRRDEHHKFAFAHGRPPGVTWLASLAFVVAVLMGLEGPRLNHWQTSRTISDRLGGHLVGSRCKLVFDNSLASQAKLLLRDCDTQAQSVTAYLGLAQPQPKVTVFVFRDAAQKRLLMGAAHTSIAKPWRREVYIVPAGYPHRVMGHELAHALSSAFGRGPLRLAGELGGLKPNPGLIEGIAVAASPGDSALSPNEWAAAMQRLHMLPPLKRVFALGFLNQNSSTSYTIAGAFVQWFHKRFGAKRLRAWYGGESLRELVGQDLPALERLWKQHLQDIKVSKPAMRYAKARFERPGVFQRRCPHAVDANMRGARQMGARGDCVGATDMFQAVLKLDPHSVGAHIGLAKCAERADNLRTARQRWTSLTTDLSVPATVRDVAMERMADLLFVAGKRERACQLYRRLKDRVFEQDRRRTIDVKLVACENVPLKILPIRTMLMKPQHPGTPAEVMVELGIWMSEVPSDGLPAYLIARQMINQRDWVAASAYLDKALAREIETSSVVREALRLRTVAACAQGQTARAAAMFSKWAHQPGVSPHRVHVLGARLGPCAGSREKR